MKKLVKNIIMIMIIISAMIVVVGCGGKKKKKSETKSAEVLAYEEAIAQLTEELDNKDKQIALYDDKFQTTKSFRNETIVQAGKKAFNKINDKIVLEGDLLPVYDNISNTAKITLSDKITITPNKNWGINLSTAETYLSMDNAYGVIKIKNYGNDIPYDSITSKLIKPILDENELDIKEQRDVFVGNEKRGEEVKTRIQVYDSTEKGNTFKIKWEDLMDEEEYEKYNVKGDSDVNVVIKAKDKLIDGILRIGAVETSRGMIEYEFITENNAGETLVDNLLSTIRVGDEALYLQ